MPRKMKTSVLVSLISLAFLLTVGTVVYRLLESWTWIDAFYFSVVTLTTVGYGDLYPTTELARLFTAFYLLMGAGVVLAALGTIGSRYLELRAEKLSKKRGDDREDQL